MPINELPGEIVVASRDQLIEIWKRSHRVCVPEADTGPGSNPDVDARVATDAVLPILAAAKTIGRNAVLEEARGKAADQWGEREGVGPRRDAIGASGFVEVRTSAGGGLLHDGDELVNEKTRLRYRTIGGGHVVDGQAVPVIGKDTGSETNLAAGTPLKWSSPGAGVGQVAVVLAQSDGSGLTGGRPAESDEEYIERIREEKRTRAASGNDAEYQLAAQNTPGVSVQKAFTYPAIMGPGTIALAFTLRPLRPGGSRIPNASQVALVESYVTHKFPADDGSFFCLLANQDTDVVLSVAWSEAANQWQDFAPWPPYYETGGAPQAIVVDAASSPLAFTLRTYNNAYPAGVQQPAAGQTIGFYDPASFAFKRKRILSIAGTGPWLITADPTYGASDLQYTPAVGQRAMPWSDSLPSLLENVSREVQADGRRVRAGVFSVFDALGPGEQVATFHDEGRRQRRQPRPPLQWPSELTEAALLRALNIAEVADAHVLEGDGITPVVGTPGVLSHILKLRYLSVFPE